jgi:hypothetical protein
LRTFGQGSHWSGRGDRGAALEVSGMPSRNKERRHLLVLAAVVIAVILPGCGARFQRVIVQRPPSPPLSSHHARARSPEATPQTPAPTPYDKPYTGHVQAIRRPFSWPKERVCTSPLTPFAHTRAELIRGSREVLVGAGLSPRWFDAHFLVLQASLARRARRVLWRLTVGPFTTVVDDEIGFTRWGTGRDVHGIGNEILCARDIGSVLSRPVAEHRLRACIGSPYADESATFGPLIDFDVSRTGLWLTARSRRVTTSSDGTVSYMIGFINVHSGRCVRGRGGEAGPS